MNGSEQIHPEQTPAAMARATMQNVSSLIERSAAIRAVLPEEPTLEMVQAVKAGIAAHMLADLTRTCAGGTHALMGAVEEFISISMGALCHFAKVDGEAVSRTAGAAVDKLHELQTQHAPSDDVGTPTVVQGEPPTKQ